MFRRILVALDGSEGSQAALNVAIRFAADRGVVLLAVSVEEHLPHYAAMVGEVDEEKQAANHYFATLLSAARERASAAGVSLQAETLAGHAAKRIVEYAALRDVDLLVIGQSGHTGPWAQLLGTTADSVVRHAPCSVLVVKGVRAGADSPPA
jgi:nucleotide-binding universal stress UspA family protein